MPSNTQHVSMSVTMPTTVARLHSHHVVNTLHRWRREWPVFALVMTVIILTLLNRTPLRLHPVITRRPFHRNTNIMLVHMATVPLVTVTDSCRSHLKVCTNMSVLDFILRMSSNVVVVLLIAKIFTLRREMSTHCLWHNIRRFKKGFKKG